MAIYMQPILKYPLESSQWFRDLFHESYYINMDTCTQIKKPSNTINLLTMRKSHILQRILHSILHWPNVMVLRPDQALEFWFERKWSCITYWHCISTMPMLGGPIKMPNLNSITKNGHWNVPWCFNLDFLMIINKHPINNKNNSPYVERNIFK